MSLNFSQDIIVATRRVLGLMDRRATSETYGCLDRAFWHYKTLTDFAGATWQQPVLGLALLYRHDFPGNDFYRSPDLKNWIEAALLWWARIQNPDGSFNEWYRNEHSFCPSAFTVWAAARAFSEMQAELSEPAALKVRRALTAGGKWLSQNDNPLIGNQMAAALAALAAVSQVTGAAEFYHAALKKKEWILRNQSREGWLPEYRGADVGYGFVALDFLTAAARILKDEEITKAALRLLEWLAPLVHPDGSVGGAHGSRGGQMFMPAGLVSFAPDSKARYMLQRHAAGLKSGNLVDPLVADDRYLAYFYFNSYVRAVVDGRENLNGETARASGYRPQKFVHYPEAGILTVNTGRVYLVIGLKMGGSVKLYREKQLVYQDAGYIVTDKKGRVYTSQWLHPRTDPEIQGAYPGELTVKLEAAFSRLRQTRPMDKLAVPFKLATQTVFASPLLARRFSRAVKRSLILKTDEAPLKLLRILRLTSDRFEIEDTLTNLSGRKLAAAVVEPVAILAHSPSARVFTANELLPAAPRLNSRELCDKINRNGKVSLKLSIPLSGDLRVLNDRFLIDEN